jgi:protein LSM14
MQNTTTSKPAASKLNDDANRDARAAVAAAMAKLPPAPGQRKHGDGGSMDNLTRQVNEMRTNEHNRTSRQPGTGEYVATHRGGRGGRGGGRTQSDQQGRKIELPKADYDFETANAKFNKQDLVKEAIASGSPVAASGEGLGADGIALGADINGGRKASDPAITIPVGVSYNKSSSFFDNISSESKDRVGDGSQRLGGREFRSEERQKNLETFGQGSVDNNYRPGYGRGRGRGRGFGRGRAGRGAFEGRGGGRNGFRGGQGSIADA